MARRSSPARPDRTRSTPAAPPTASPQHRPADQHRPRPQGQGLDHVGAAADAAVHVDLAAVADRGRHLGQGVGGGDHGVELAAAVVGHDHPGRARVQAGQGVVAA